MACTNGRGSRAVRSVDVRGSRERLLGSRLPVSAIALLVLSVLAISAGGLSHGVPINVLGIVVGLLLPSGAYPLATPLGAIYAVMSLLMAAMTTEIFVPYFLQIIHGMTLLVAGWTLASLSSARHGDDGADRLIRLSPVVVLAALLVLVATIPLNAWRGAARRRVPSCTASRLRRSASVSS
uniref:hypothetical protein n=1 Tax=Burkholderia anthina TaxID=179879 RepID=UPI00158F35CA|nr:hypothetical protein [Burkholderia anthina]